MQLNFRGRSQNINGYADQPFTFVDPDAHRLMGHISSIDLIENGQRRGREYWQKKQFGNLVNHAYLRSEFWRQRIPSGAGRQEAVQNFPILTRKEIAAQVEKEGSIFADKKQSIESYQTTGSTGTPLKVFVCPQSSYYNVARGFAQFFIDNMPFNENRVEITPAVRADDLEKAVVYKTGSTWAGPLSRIYQNGTNKVLGLDRDIAGLVEEMSKERVGYLVCHSRFVEQILEYGGPDLFTRLGIKAWFHKSDFRSRDAVEQLKKIGVSSLSNYSAGEIGPIAFECRSNEGYFHVAHTNRRFRQIA
jgi:phenylacetate-CoA ligase